MKSRDMETALLTAAENLSPKWRAWFASEGVDGIAMIRAGFCGIVRAVAGPKPGDSFAILPGDDAGAKAWVLLGLWDGLWSGAHFDDDGRPRANLCPSLTDLLIFNPADPADWRVLIGGANVAGTAALGLNPAAFDPVGDDVAQPLRLTADPLAWLAALSMATPRAAALRTACVVSTGGDHMRDILCREPAVQVAGRGDAQALHAALKVRRPLPPLPDIFIDPAMAATPAASTKTAAA